MKASLNVIKLEGHDRSVRGVAFSPRQSHILASGAYDGLLNLYDAKSALLLRSTQLLDGNLRSINAIDFVADGSKIVAGSNSRKLFVIDVETGETINSYENSIYNGPDRAALSACSKGVGQGDGTEKFLIVCSNVDGRGLNFFDIRDSHHVKLLPNMHEKTIRDVDFLHKSWHSNASPFDPTIITACEDGMSKVIDWQGRTISSVDAGCPLFSVTVTPEPFNQAAGEYESVISLGGDRLLITTKPGDVRELFTENNCSPIWKLQYTHVGTELFLGCDDGTVRKYRRTADGHFYEGLLYSHHNDVEDLAISYNDEYLATASQDRSVGLLRLRSDPIHGVSEDGNLI